MVFKWALVAFGVTSAVLFVLGKALAFMNPPRPGRPPSPAERRVAWTLRWTVWVPLVVAAAMLALSLR